MFMESLFELRY